MPRGGWRGGGRKPKPEGEKYIRFQISCPPQLKEKLDNYLETQSLDRSSYISKLIEQDLERVKPID